MFRGHSDKYDLDFIIPSGYININGLSAWFDPPSDQNRTLPDSGEDKFLKLLESVSNVHRLLDDLIDEGKAPRDIYLFGHSQGGALALAAGLTYPISIGGVATISAYLALTDAMKITNTQTPFFLQHSQFDDNVGVCWAEYAKQHIHESGNNCLLKIWDIPYYPHSIHPEQLMLIIQKFFKTE